MRFLLIFLFFPAILFGQSKKNSKETQTIVSGVLPDLKNETIILMPVDDYFPCLVYASDDADDSLRIALSARRFIHQK